MWPIIVVTCKPINTFVGELEYGSVSIHGCGEIWNLFPHVELDTVYTVYLTHSLHSLVRYPTQEINYIFPHIHVLFSI